MNNKKSTAEFQEEIRKVISAATETAVKEAVSIALEYVKVLVDTSVEVNEVVSPDEVPSTLVSEEDAKAPVESTDETLYGGYTVEALNAMRYNEFKKVAAIIGVKCTGTRQEIMDRILSTNSSISEEDDADEVTTPVEDDFNAEVEETSLAEETENEEDYESLAQEIVDVNGVDYVLEELSNNGIKATKKNVVAKLAKALEDGTIELEDEEDEESETEETYSGETNDSDPEDGIEIDGTSYFEEYDFEGLNNPDEMSDSRKKATVTEQSALIDKYIEGKLSDKEMKKFISKYTKDEVAEEIESYDSESLFCLYCEIKKSLIDNEGESHAESDPYECGEADCCCGHKLKYVKKSNSYICEICGEEYDEE